MSEFKRVILKDPVTGDFLAPKVPGTLMYEEVNGTDEAPFSTTVNADTLGGYSAAAFVLAENADFALSAHTHSADDITSGILSVARGGTGVASLAELATAIAPSLGSIKIKTGSYTGDGGTSISTTSKSQTISLDFTPIAVFVFPIDGVGYKNTGSYGRIPIYSALAVTGQNATAIDGAVLLSIVDNGFTVNLQSTKSTVGDYEYDEYAATNYDSKVFNYIALG